MNDRLFNFDKTIKNLSDFDNRIYMIIDDYKPKVEIKYEHQKEFSTF